MGTELKKSKKSKESKRKTAASHGSSWVYEPNFLKLSIKPYPLGFTTSQWCNPKTSPWPGDLWGMLIKDIACKDLYGFYSSIALQHELIFNHLANENG
jgi:hypothetical protein